MAIVDQHEHRSLIGEIHHQPVEAVESLEAGISTRRVALLGLEQSRRGPGRAGEQIGLSRCPVDHGLQQLAHNAERKRLLEL